jgi:hypothetical protein
MRVLHVRPQVRAPPAAAGSRRRGARRQKQQRPVGLGGADWSAGRHVLLLLLLQ